MKGGQADCLICRIHFKAIAEVSLCVMVCNSNKHSCVVTPSEQTGEHNLNYIKKKVLSSFCTDPDFH